MSFYFGNKLYTVLETENDSVCHAERILGLIEKVIDDDVNYPKDNFTRVSEEIETSGNKPQMLMMLLKTQRLF